MKNSTKFTLEMQKELNDSIKQISLISVIIGSIILLAYIVVGTILPTEPIWLEAILIVGSVLFGFGLVFLLNIRKTNKKIQETNVVNNYEFFEDYCLIVSTRNGEEIANAKVYYKEILKFKDTKNYLFFYTNITNAFPVEKKQNTPEEISKLKEYFIKGVPENKAKK